MRFGNGVVGEGSEVDPAYPTAAAALLNWAMTAYAMMGMVREPLARIFL